MVQWFNGIMVQCNNATMQQYNNGNNLTMETMQQCNNGNNNSSYYLKRLKIISFIF